MDDKIIKVRTDGDILRDAYALFGFTLAGSDYVLYFIDRDDGVNDNIFVSKLIKSNDSTYSMHNIEDSNEKTAVSDVVKQLIKYSIDDNDKEVLVTKSVSLSGGKVIELFPVNIPNEQSISIKMTYVTTVKKSVNEVAKKYYSSVKKEEEVFESNIEAPFIEPITKSEPVSSIIEPVVPVEDIPKVEITTENIIHESIADVPVIEKKDVDLVMPSLEDVTSNDSLNDEVKEIVPDMFKKAESVALVQESVEKPKNGDFFGTEPVVNMEIPVIEPIPVVENTVVSASVVNDVPLKVEEPMKVETPVNVINGVVNEKPLDNRIVFDGSKESSLHNVLGEVSESIAVSDISAVKNFGEDEPINTFTAEEKTENHKVLTKKAGFANSKLCMFIAIGFFTASCAFLGYEAYSYFSIMK